MQALPNVSVRFSSDSVTGAYVKGLHGSVIIPTPADVKKGMTLCEAYSHEGKCNGCRACYDKAVKVIAYPAHGVSMAKVIRILRAA
jgi:flavoprotein